MCHPFIWDLLQARSGDQAIWISPVGNYQRLIVPADARHADQGSLRDKNSRTISSGDKNRIPLKPVESRRREKRDLISFPRRTLHPCRSIPSHCCLWCHCFLGNQWPRLRHWIRRGRHFGLDRGSFQCDHRGCCNGFSSLRRLHHAVAVGQYDKNECRIDGQ